MVQKTFQNVALTCQTTLTPDHTSLPHCFIIVRPRLVFHALASAVSSAKNTLLLLPIFQTLIWFLVPVMDREAWLQSMGLQTGGHDWATEPPPPPPPPVKQHLSAKLVFQPLLPTLTCRNSPEPEAQDSVVTLPVVFHSVASKCLLIKWKYLRVTVFYAKRIFMSGNYLTYQKHNRWQVKMSYSSPPGAFLCFVYSHRGYSTFIFFFYLFRQHLLFFYLKIELLKFFL